MGLLNRHSVAHGTHPLRAGAIALGMAAAITASTAGVAAATPAPPQPPLPTQGAPAVDKQVLKSLGSFVPAIIGSAATPDTHGKINGDLLAQANAFAMSKDLPPQLRAVWNQITAFLKGTATPQSVAAVADSNGVPIPTGPNKPKIQQFLYPTIGVGCIPGGNSIGTALATAGPQQAPAPGPKRGQAGFVYTSLGTGPALDNAKAPLTLIWINIDSGKTGELTLKRNDKINVGTDGPGTFTGIATTGKGRVISAIYGNVTTQIKGKPVSCGIAPTVGLAFI